MDEKEAEARPLMGTIFLVFQGKLIQVHMYAVVIILCNRTYVTKNSKDTALNLTSNRGFRGRLTLTEDILVDYQY